MLQWEEQFFYINDVKRYQLKAKDFERKTYPLYLGNISRDFTSGLNLD